MCTNTTSWKKQTNSKVPYGQQQHEYKQATRVQASYASAIIIHLQAQDTGQNQTGKCNTLLSHLNKNKQVTLCDQHIGCIKCNVV